MMPVASFTPNLSWKGTPEAVEAMKLWHRLLWRLETDLPSSWASSCPVPGELEDAFVLLYEAKKLMKACH
jgi:hypothetical protein